MAIPCGYTFGFVSLQFVNRETELDFLNEKWNRNEAQLIIIYGKRRVGKTELAIQFVKDEPHIYFLCERIPIHKQLQKFTEAISEYFKDEFLPAEGFKNWEVAFKYISNKKEKIAIIIDEFPYLVETDVAIPSTFQKAWDIYLQRRQGLYDPFGLKYLYDGGDNPFLQSTFVWNEEQGNF